MRFNIKEWQDKFLTEDLTKSEIKKIAEKLYDELCKNNKDVVVASIVEMISDGGKTTTIKSYAPADNNKAATYTFQVDGVDMSMMVKFSEYKLNLQKNRKSYKW